MRPDNVIAIRNVWDRFNYAPLLPASTILADRDWLAYVAAMAEAMPVDVDLAWPTEEDVAWAWPDGVAIVLDEPVDVRHAIVSEEKPGSPLPVPVPAHYETQTCRGVILGPLALAPARTIDGDRVDQEVAAHSVLWIGEDPADIISGTWIPGIQMHPSRTGEISFSSRFLLSIVTALGHRLTRLDEVSGGRQERRRVERELPSLRVIRLATGATVSRSETTGTVEWTRRWMVRGHWRLQPHGPRRSLRKAIWIDPYVKGPEDKPLDVRPTVWTTGGRPA